MADKKYLELMQWTQGVIDETGGKINTLEMDADLAAEIQNQTGYVWKENLIANSGLPSVDEIKNLKSWIKDHFGDLQVEELTQRPPALTNYDLDTLQFTLIRLMNSRVEEWSKPDRKGTLEIYATEVVLKADSQKLLAVLTATMDQRIFGSEVKSSRVEGGVKEGGEHTGDPNTNVDEKITAQDAAEIARTKKIVDAEIKMLKPFLERIKPRNVVAGMLKEKLEAAREAIESCSEYSSTENKMLNLFNYINSYDAPESRKDLPVGEQRYRVCEDVRQYIKHLDNMTNRYQSAVADNPVQQMEHMFETLNESLPTEADIKELSMVLIQTIQTMRTGTLSDLQHAETKILSQRMKYQAFDMKGNRLKGITQI